MALGTIDIIFVVAIIGYAVLGAIKGFVSQIVSIISLILGIWCASKLAGLLATYIQKWFALGESTVYIISFAIILIVVIILCNFLGKGIEKIVKLTMLNWLNRLLGALFAAAKIIIILSVIVYIIDYAGNAWHILPDGFGSSSLCYNSFLKISKSLFPYLQNILG